MQTKYKELKVNNLLECKNHHTNNLKFIPSQCIYKCIILHISIYIKKKNNLFTIDI